MNRQIILLRIAGGILVGFGILISGATIPGLSLPSVFMLDLMIWPLDGAQGIAAPETRFIAAVAGGIMVGWGVLIWQIAPLMLIHARQMQKFIGWSAATWFVVDSLGSILAGVPLNVLGNLAFLALLYFAVRQPNHETSTA